MLRSKDSSSKTQATESTEAAKQLAVIDDDFNKHFAAFDALFSDMAKAFPGIYRGWDLIGTSSSPTSKSLTRSFNDLFEKDFGLESFKQDGRIIEGQHQQEFTFKNGSGRSSFTFRRITNEPEDSAEGIADSIEFIAQQAMENQTRRPRVFNILDVARNYRKSLL